MSAVKRHSPAIVAALAAVFALVGATSQIVVVCLCLVFTVALIVAELERQRLGRRW